MQIYEVPLINNTIKDISGRLVGETILQDSLNILFDNNKIKNRYGIYELSESLPEEVVRISLYKQLYSNNIYVVAFTISNIYYLNTAGKWECVTRNFNIGDCACSTTSVTLTPPTAATADIDTANDVAVSWSINVDSLTGIEVGMHVTGTNIPSKTYVAAIDTVGSNIILSQQTSAIPSGEMTFTHHFHNTKWGASGAYIAFGYTDINLVPDDEWYAIASFDSDTALTLSASAGTISAGDYVIKREYTGDVDNTWQSCFPYEDSPANDKIMLSTNGVDFLQIWRGIQDDELTYFEDLLTYPNICKHVGFWGTVGAEHIICSNVYDTATSAWNSSAIEVSDAGEISWQDGAVYPLFDSSSPILGIVSLQTRFVIYKKDSISLAEASYSSDVTNPLTIQQGLKRSLGTCSIDTVVDTGQFHLFFTGSRIAKFDGYNHAYVDEGVYLYINRIMNKNYVERSFAFHLEDMQLYCLCIPTGDAEKCNLVVVYNYESNNFTFWDFTAHGGDTMLITAKGLYIPSSAITWEDRIIDGITGAATASSTVTITGGVDGLLPGMRFTIATIDHTGNLYIKSVGASSIVIGETSDETSIDPALITPHAVTCSGAVRCGFTFAQSIQRWSDLSPDASSSRIILGDTNGYMYELSSAYTYDYVDTDEVINSYFESKDYELNKGLTFLMTGITLRLGMLENGTDDYFDGSVFISASTNYGLNWSEEVELELDGTEYFMEKKIALHMRGKAIRFKVRSESAFVFENCFLEFNVEGRSFKYDR